MFRAGEPEFIFLQVINGRGAQAANRKPHAIIAKTIKGKGVSFMENNIAWHGNAPKKEDADKAVKEILNG